MIRRLAHLCLITRDRARLVAFYVEGLGLRVAFDFVNAEGEVFGTYLACGDSTFIEIFDQALAAKQWGGNTDPLQAGNRYGHLCLEATGLADLRTTLLARGVEVGEIRTGLDQSLQMWTADPDGNRVELMEYTHRSWQLRAPGLV
jgi:catechol 2,3-dioxygenase-like lactoylglutathione lyase family enzyme